MVELPLDMNESWILEVRLLNGRLAGRAAGRGLVARIGAPARAGVYLLSLTAGGRTSTTVILRYATIDRDA